MPDKEIHKPSFAFLQHPNETARQMFKMPQQMSKGLKTP